MTAEAGEVRVVKHYMDIPGWYHWSDRAMFDTVLRAQPDTGHIVELGAYLGRSAVILGNHVRPGERFVVVDLFGADPTGALNRWENSRYYDTLTRKQFEANYLALHEQLPEVVQGLSSEIVDHVEPQSVRFLHVDASHMYDQVAEDIRNARVLLQPDGVVVLDDYRSAHTPGVAAASWEAVITGGLRPFAVTPHKMYATWGDADRYRAVVEDSVTRDKRLGRNVHEIAGHTVLQIWVAPTPPAPAAPEKPQAAPPKPQPAPQKPRETKKPAPPPATLAGRVRHVIARDIAPPALTRWVRRRKSAKTARGAQ